MHQIIFVAEPDQVDQLEPDENPALSFPCMSSQQFHRDARAQLYALVTGCFVDEAASFEMLHRSLSDEGPFIYTLDQDVTARLARLDEDQLGEIAELWLETTDIEELDQQLNDLYEFIYQYAHFCHTANEDDLALFIYSDS